MLLAYINNKLSETRFTSPQIDSKIANTFFMLVQDVSTQARREEGATSAHATPLQVPEVPFLLIKD